MICEDHRNYIPHNGDPDNPHTCYMCWRARADWLHENRKLHIVQAQELREAAGHYTPPNARIQFLEAQVQKLKKQLSRVPNPPTATP